MPLIPRLSGITRFAEPCCGDGALVRHLAGAGLECVYARDLGCGCDARQIELADLKGADAIITNPPHERELLHALIERFGGLAPTWLLIDWDWACTRQARELLRGCALMVPVGRVKWVAGSAHAGFDNFAWYQFVPGWTFGPRLLVD